MSRQVAAPVLITTVAYNAVAEIITRSGAAQEIEAAIAKKQPGGRARTITVNTFLTCLVLTYIHHKSAMLTETHRTMSQGLPLKVRVRLGLTDKRGRTLVSIASAYRLLSAIHRAYCWTGDALGLDAYDRKARRSEFAHIIDRLVTASLPDGLRSTGAVAVDATAIDSAGTSVATDPDAAWGYRTKTHDNATKNVFGYQAVVTTSVPTKLGDNYPLLATSVELVPADDSGSELDAALRLIAGKCVSEVIADRGFTYAKPERFAHPLREAGIRLVADIHPHDKGIRDFQGIQMIDGYPHCPAMPDEFARIDRPSTLALLAIEDTDTPKERAVKERHNASVEKFNTFIARRWETYAFRRNATTKNGEQFKCPAQAGLVRCAAKPGTVAYPKELPLIANPPTSDTAPKCCTQSTVLIPWDALGKNRQRDYWGSPEWQASYARRSRIEAVFSGLKSTKTGGVKRGWTWLRGILKTTLMFTVAVIAHNIRALQFWAQRYNDGDTKDSAIPAAWPTNVTYDDTHEGEVTSASP